MNLNLKDYEEICPLGSGGFADVVLVRHKTLGYVRALKLSHDIIMEGEKDKKWIKFLNECRLLLRIQNGGHPNIVKIYQPRLENGRAMVEMDYIEGDTLNKYIDREKFLPITEVWKFIKDIVGAMAYCHVDVYKYMQDPKKDGTVVDDKNGRKFNPRSPEHERKLVQDYGVCHNDLHANNVMRRDLDGAYVLLDFGLAKQNQDFVNSSNKDAGCLEYRAPEKYYKLPPTFESDVYSLGVLLFKVLTGAVPFSLLEDTEAGVSDFWQKVLHDPVPEILPLRRAASGNPEYERDYPEQFDHIINKCLAKNREERYANAKEVLQALEEAYNAFDEKKLLKNANVKMSGQLTMAYERIDSLNTLAIEQDKQLSALDSDLKASKKNSRILVAAFAVLFIGLVVSMFWGFFGDVAPKNDMSESSTDSIIAANMKKLEELNASIAGDAVTETVHDTVMVVRHDTVRVNVPVAETKVEYRTPPAVQAELDKLKAANADLRESLKKEKVRADREHRLRILANENK